jgi:hypothetical protein
MRSHILLIMACPLFAGCFTITTINKAKFDTKAETADSVLSSYKDDKGNLSIIYTKPASRYIYKLSQPIDSIVTVYRKSKTIDLVNPEAESAFKGVFFTDNVNGEKGYQRLVLFDDGNRMTDTAGLAQEMGYNKNIAKVLHARLYIPVGRIDTVNAMQRVRTRAVSFVLNIDVGDSSVARKETYLVVLQPRKRKYSRYLLLPLTVGLDAITLPVQAFVFGALWLLGKRHAPS